MIDLRLGAWQEVLADIKQCDAIITDPPYSARTHQGHDSGAAERQKVRQEAKHKIEYSPWIRADVIGLVNMLGRVCNGWIVAITSHDLIPYWEEGFRLLGRYYFAPIPWIFKRPRLIGDGPANWACYIMVSRPKNREFSTWGCLPGAYFSRLMGQKSIVIGQKPIELMRAIIRDYTKPGDLIVDPFAGSGTTLIAAAMEGRRAIGAEIDPDTYAKAKARIDAGYTPSLF